LVEHPVFRFGTGKFTDFSNVMTELGFPHADEALRIKRLHECEEYEALCGRIQDAHEGGTMLSMVDMMLAMFFAFDIKSHLINLDDHVKYQYLFALPGSPIDSNKAAQADLGDKVTVKQKLYEANKPQLTDLSVARVRELIRQRRSTSHNEKA